MGILKELEIDYDLEIVDEFTEHLGIMCESIEPLSVSLIHKENFHNNINDLFRIFHNIKSAANFVNLAPIVNLATLVEEVLEEARDIQGPASDEFIDWLLLINDQFATYRLDVEDDREYFSLLNPLIIKIPKNLQK